MLKIYLYSVIIGFISLITFHIKLLALCKKYNLTIPASNMIKDVIVLFIPLLNIVFTVLYVIGTLKLTKEEMVELVLKLNKIK